MLGFARNQLHRVRICISFMEYPVSEALAETSQARVACLPRLRSNDATGRPKLLAVHRVLEAIIRTGIASRMGSTGGVVAHA
jgi:hypothetical protein